MSFPVLAQSWPCHLNPNLSDPNNSQRFFEEGREQFEQEIERLQNRQSFTDESLLEIDEKLLQAQPSIEWEIPSEEKNQRPQELRW